MSKIKDMAMGERKHELRMEQMDCTEMMRGRLTRKIVRPLLRSLGARGSNA